MISNRQFEQMQACREALISALMDEMAKRKFKQYADWVVAERDALTLAANRWIVEHTETHTITAAQVEEVENLAVGHSDYASKLVLYVSELVYGLRETQR